MEKASSAAIKGSNSGSDGKRVRASERELLHNRVSWSCISGDGVAGGGRQEGHLGLHAMTSGSTGSSNDTMALIRMARQMIEDGREEDELYEERRISAIERSGAETTRALWQREHQLWIDSSNASSSSSSIRNYLAIPQLPNCHMLGTCIQLMYVSEIYLLSQTSTEWHETIGVWFIGRKLHRQRWVA